MQTKNELTEKGQNAKTDEMCSPTSSGKPGVIKTGVGGRHKTIYVPELRRGVGEHILICQRVLGKLLPKGAEVHHFNCNRRDNRNQNLVICENTSYHRLLHARQRVVELGGDPETEKFCFRCKRLVLRINFHTNSSNYDGLQTACRVCHRKMKYPHLENMAS